MTYEVVVDPKLNEPDGPTPLTMEKLARGVNALDAMPASEF